MPGGAGSLLGGTRVSALVSASIHRDMVSKLRKVGHLVMSWVGLAPLSDAANEPGRPCKNSVCVSNFRG